MRFLLICLCVLLAFINVQVSFSVEQFSGVGHVLGSGIQQKPTEQLQLHNNDASSKHDSIQQHVANPEVQQEINPENKPSEIEQSEDYKPKVEQLRDDQSELNQSSQTEADPSQNETDQTKIKSETEQSEIVSVAEPSEIVSVAEPSVVQQSQPHDAVGVSQMKDSEQLPGSEQQLQATGVLPEQEQKSRESQMQRLKKNNPQLFNNILKKRELKKKILEEEGLQANIHHSASGSQVNSDYKFTEQQRQHSQSAPVSGPRSRRNHSQKNYHAKQVASSSVAHHQSGDQHEEIFNTEKILSGMWNLLVSKYTWIVVACVIGGLIVYKLIHKILFFSN